MRPPKRCATSNTRVRGVSATWSAEGRERPRIEVDRDGPQPVSPKDPDHVGMRDGRLQNLIPGPEILCP